MVNKFNIPRPIYFTAKIHTCIEHSLVKSIIFSPLSVKVKFYLAPKLPPKLHVVSGKRIGVDKEKYINYGAIIKIRFHMASC